MRALYIINTADQPYESSEALGNLLEQAKRLKPLDQLPFLDRWWIQVSAQFAAKWDKRLPSELKKSRLNVNASTEQTVKCLLRDGQHYEAIQKVWIDEIRSRLSAEAKRLVFCECLLWFLGKKIDLSLNYIQALGRGHKAMSYIIADAFEFLADRYFELQEPLPQRFYEVLMNCLTTSPRLSTALSQKLVFLVLRSASLKQAQNFWHTCRSLAFRPAAPTCIGAAHRFASLGDHETAMKLLKDSIRLGMRTDSTAFTNVARSILRRSVVKSNDYSAGLYTLQVLADLNMKIDSHLITIHIHNAMEAGDVRSALRFYDRMREAKMDINDYTYTIILSGLKRAASQDVAAMRVVLVHAIDALPTLERPHYVATEILHYTYLQRFKFQTMDDGQKFMIANRKAFSAVVQTYCEYFDPEPLRYFGVPEEFLASPPPEIPMETTPPPIRLTIGAFLHHVAYTSPDDLPRMFDSFVDKLRRGDNGRMVELVATNHIYNAFLMALCENESTLGKIPDVLVHMVDKEIHQIPMTSVHTWNILITGFMRHKHTAAVRRVLKIMDDLGEEPNEVTWNSLVQGWLRNEEVEMAIEAMKKMERNNMVVNDKSLREIAFSRQGSKITEAMNEDDEDYLVPESSDEPVEKKSAEERQDTKVGSSGGAPPPKLIKRVYVGDPPSATWARGSRASRL
ncbi:hypothetical protein IWX49DRAFT_588622 [Phyllosticta citricarpa]|uniref:Pentatricopeptide repeat protein n=2 Tax=Phyllosticta TaxID=121621 RepID=A0ABR1MIL3_9PEZI